MSDGAGDESQSGFEDFSDSNNESVAGEQTTEEAPVSSVDALPEMTGDGFNEYYFRRNAERNVEENHPERNDPGHSWPAGRFEPHQLGNCKRQWFYRWLNAPSEESAPHGIFAIGHFLEEDIIEPWLRDLFEPAYEIDNAVHVSVDIDTMTVANYQADSPDRELTDIDALGIGYNQPNDQEPVQDAESVSLTIAGSTDPAICDSETGDVIALTEVKSTSNLARQKGPKRMHLMQLHAYMTALGIENGFMIYVDRDELLNPKIFDVSFDDDVWESVVEWVEETAEYALRGALPPANPPEGWMCKYCEYQNRCGEGRSNLASDMRGRGFAPGFTGYPRNKVEDHLAAYPDVKLTPSLALKFPELAREHDVAMWRCENCTAEFDYTDDGFDAFGNGEYETPYCPACENVFGESVYLTVDVV